MNSLGCWKRLSALQKILNLHRCVYLVQVNRVGFLQGPYHNLLATL